MREIVRPVLSAAARVDTISQPFYAEGVIPPNRMPAIASKAPVTRAELRQELEGWATEIKGSFNAVEQRLSSVEAKLGEHTTILNEHTTILNEHTRRLAAIEEKLEPLERIAVSLEAIRQNTAAMLGLYRRLDHRDQVFADKLGADLNRVDAKFIPPPA